MGYTILPFFAFVKNCNELDLLCLDLLWNITYIFHLKFGALKLSNIFTFFSFKRIYSVHHSSKIWAYSINGLFYAQHWWWKLAVLLSYNLESWTCAVPVCEDIQLRFQNESSSSVNYFIVDQSLPSSRSGTSILAIGEIPALTVSQNGAICWS